MQTDTTKVRVKTAPQLTEIEYAQFKYDQARAAMLKNPCEETVNEFLAANKNLTEVEDAYRIGKRLLLERAKRWFSRMTHYGRE